MVFIQHSTITKWLFVATSAIAIGYARSDNNDNDRGRAAARNSLLTTNSNIITKDSSADVTLMKFDNTKSASELIDIFLSNNNAVDVEVRNVHSSSHECLSYFTNGHSMGTTSTLDNNERHPILSNEGIILSTGKPQHFLSSSLSKPLQNQLNNNWGGDVTSTNWQASGDVELDEFLRETYPTMEKVTYDACELEFEFRCLNGNNLDSATIDGDGNSNVGAQKQQQQQQKVSFTYNFASEEYYEQLSPSYGDVFGLFLNGQNIATLPSDAVTYVGIDTVNPFVNSQYSIGNDPGMGVGKGGVLYPKIEADGLTVPLTANGIVNPTTTNPSASNDNEGWNTMKIVVADVGDRLLDSWILLGGGSFKCEAIGNEGTSASVNEDRTPLPTPQPTTSQPSSSPTSAPTEKPIPPTFPPRPKPDLPDPTGTPSSMPSSMPSTSLSPTLRPTSSPTSNPTTSSPTTVKPTQRPIGLLRPIPGIDLPGLPLTTPKGDNSAQGSDGGIEGGMQSSSWWKTNPPTLRPTAPTLSPTGSPIVSVVEDLGTGSPTASPISPTSAPSENPSSGPSMTTVPSVEPTEMPCMEFEQMNATNLLQDVLLSPNNIVASPTPTPTTPTTIIHFQNILSSSHACYSHFTHGYRSGTFLATDPSTLNYPERIGTPLMPDSGLIMSSGNPQDFCGNDSDQSTKNWYEGGDEELTTVVQESNPFAESYDACVIEFQFQCLDSTTNLPLSNPHLSFNYIFGSEEYYEYINSDFNDAFAFFLNGNNIALLPDGVTEVTINNVNYGSNEEWFVGNDISEANGVQYPRVEADGFTTKLTASASIESGMNNSTENGGWNSVKLVIADVADRILDSWVLLEAGSFECRNGSELENVPTGSPSRSPTKSPSGVVTQSPTVAPTKSPSVSPTRKSTSSPTTLLNEPPPTPPNGTPTSSPTTPATIATSPPTSKPTSPPTSSPTLTTTPTLSHIPTFLPTSTPTSSPQLQCMAFDSKDAVSLVRNVLRDPNGFVEFRNIQSTEHGCYRYFYDGEVMGSRLGTGEQLLPSEGIIMSSGHPEEFCWNDSDQNSKNFYLPNLFIIVTSYEHYSRIIYKM